MKACLPSNQCTVPENTKLLQGLIIQFPVFVQPYTQKPLTLYQIETIPVPILDMNEKADSYTLI